MTEMISMPEVLVYYDAIQQEEEVLEFAFAAGGSPGTGSEAWTMYENAKV